jgi:hypothetical protein
MKARTVWLLSGIVCCGAFGSVIYRVMDPRPAIEFSGNGLSSLKYRGMEYLSYGDMRLSHLIMRDGSGHEVKADMDFTSEVDARAAKVTEKFSWGDVTAQYATKPGKFYISITTNNRSLNTIEQVSYEPLGLKFPGKVAEYDGNIPLVGHNSGNPTLIPMSWTASTSGMIVLANEDVERPLVIGFPWALDKPANTTFPLRVVVGRDDMLPDMLPYISRTIPPGHSDSYTLSLRFGPGDSNVAKLGNDILQRFATRFPSELKWKDRRPVGTVFLASASLKTKINPRGWLLDHSVDVNTPKGKEELRHRILKTADVTIDILRNMKAQGMITWDIEGQEFPGTTYAGDPRQFSAMAPEMADIADDYFKRFRSAGFRVGVCIRPQEILIDRARNVASERDVSDPGQELARKIAWAKERWGATMFYVDTNGEPSKPLDADILEKVAKQFPDVLLIPEHKNVRYFSFSAPYFSLREGLVSTPPAVRAVYPNAFSFINTADGPIEKKREDLAAAVKQGDILLYRSWYNDPANAEVKSFY